MHVHPDGVIPIFQAGLTAAVSRQFVWREPGGKRGMAGVKTDGLSGEGIIRHIFEGLHSLPRYSVAAKTDR